MAATRYTIQEIKRIADQHGSHYFSRETMRFFRNTMRDFRVVHRGDAVYVVNTCGGSVYRFDPLNGDLSCVPDDQRMGIISVEQMDQYARNRRVRMGF